MSFERSDNIRIKLENIKSLKTNNEIEIELRYQHPNKNTFNIFKNYASSSLLRKEEVFIMDIRNDNIIKRNYYIKKNNTYEKESTVILQKKNIYPFEYINNFKLSFQEEQVITNFTQIDSSLIRIKNRSSYKINDNWRLDLTIVYSEKVNQIEDLKKIVHTIFGNEKHNLNISYEIELEYIGDIKNLNYPEINNLTLEFNNNLTGSNTFNVKSYIKKKLHLPYDFISIKQSLPNVITITHDNYGDIYPPMQYVITTKTDGIHALLITIKNKYIIMLDGGKIIEFEKDGISPDNIFEGEYMNDKFYIFDILLLNNTSLTNYSYHERIEHINEIKDLHKMNVKIKKFTLISSMEILQSVIDEYSSLSSSEESEEDGLIFNAPNQTYFKSKIYKWKPLKHNTIDFLIKEYNNKIYLFNGIDSGLLMRYNIYKCKEHNDIFPKEIREKRYIPIQFSPPFSFGKKIYILDSLSQNWNIDFKKDNIGEFKWDSEKEEFQLVRIREDRSGFGNDYKVAESIWRNIINPFYIEDLMTGVSSYFKTRKDVMHTNYVYFMSMVKERYMKTLHGNVVDLGAGRGQDIKRYYQSDIKHLLVIDNDKTALTEFMRRRIQYFEKYKNIKNKTSFSLNIKLADFTQPIEFTEDELNYKYDILTANLSIHYAFGNEQNVRNVIETINKLNVKKIIIMCMFGDKVFNLLSLNNIEYDNAWNYIENDVLKLSIKRLYKSNELTDFGQKIAVKLPFSAEEYYEEYLINLQSFSKLLNEYNYEIYSSNTLDYYFNKIDATKLNDVEKMYVSLYGVIKIKRI